MDFVILGGSVVRKNHEPWEEQRPNGQRQGGVVLVKSHNIIMDQTTTSDNTSINHTTGTQFTPNLGWTMVVSLVLKTGCDRLGCKHAHFTEL